MRGRYSAAPWLGLAALACGVPAPPQPEQNVALPEAGPCGRGFVVIESNYQSTNVGLVSLAGEVLTGSLLASTLPAGELVPTLSGDVVASSSLAHDDTFVLVDRSPESSRLLFVELSSGAIVKRVALDTGFASYPQDYVEISPEKGYVTRFGHNRRPGRAPFDHGSDVIVVSPESGEIIGSIDLRASLPDAEDTLPRPSRVALVGERAFVLLATLPVDGFVAAVESQLAVVNTKTDEVEDTIALSGLRNCAGMTVTEAGERLAVTCSALTDSDGGSDVEASGIALVALTPEPHLERVIPGSALGARPVGFSSSFIERDTLLVTSFGVYDGNDVIAKDRLLRVDLATEGVSELLQGEPFTLGAISCAEGCGTCLVADAARRGGVVHRYVYESGEILRAQTIKLEETIGLPPRYLSRF